MWQHNLDNQLLGCISKLKTDEKDNQYFFVSSARNMKIFKMLFGFRISEPKYKQYNIIRPHKKAIIINKLQVYITLGNWSGSNLIINLLPPIIKITCGLCMIHDKTK